MSSVRLDLQSEAYSPAGNLAADGFRKLLGAPSLDLVQTLVREAVQNSCDAALGDGNAEIHFRVRKLTARQLEILRDCVLAELPRDEGASALEGFLRSDEARVLEICDFNTSGLSGPTRADVAPVGSEETDFVDFLRNVGSPRNTFHGGGTYGYGKTSLYVASSCATVIVDSETTSGGRPIRRLMGSRLGSAFEDTDSSGARRRYTGRHWWGLDAGDGVVDPLEGDRATRIAEDLGLPPRDQNSRGTSIMILDPIFDSDEDARAIDMVREALLWFFWPRLLASTPEQRRLKFRLFHGDREEPIPAPEEFPPLDLFARALNNLRERDASVSDVRSFRPRRVLGRMSIVKGLAGARVMRAGTEDSLFPRRNASIAVMRPVELVVRYYEGTPYAEDALEWAGVFVAADDEDIEEAFARAEPPAHDDWQPDSIPDRAQASIVRIAVREIRKAASEVVNPAIAPVASLSDGPSLAAVAGILGRGLVGQGREGAGPRITGPGGGSSRRKHRISSPVFRRLQRSGTRTIAVFAATVQTDGTRDNQLSLTPALAMDGGTVARDGDLEVPPVVAVRQGDRILGGGERVELGRLSGELEIDVEMPLDRAVALSARLDEIGAGE